MELKALTVEGFINETASDSPAPGGGSVAALNAASGAALIAMVAGLTIGKEKYAEAEVEMQDVSKKAIALKDRFIAFIDEDSAAFNEIMAAFKMPKNSEDEKKVRTEAIQKSYKGAALVPFHVGEKANELFALAEAVILRGNPNAVTDGAVAAMNARSAVKGAFLNVKINLGGIKDEAFVKDLTEKMKVIEDLVDQKEKDLLSKVKL